jgi:hypothetical protein
VSVHAWGDRRLASRSGCSSTTIWVVRLACHLGYLWCLCLLSCLTSQSGQILIQGDDEACSVPMGATNVISIRSRTVLGIFRQVLLCVEALLLSLLPFPPFLTLFSPLFFEYGSHFVAQAYSQFITQPRAMAILLPHAYLSSVNNYMKVTLKLADDLPCPWLSQELAVAATLCCSDLSYSLFLPVLLWNVYFHTQNTNG